MAVLVDTKCISRQIPTLRQSRERGVLQVHDDVRSTLADAAAELHDADAQWLRQAEAELKQRTVNLRKISDLVEAMLTDAQAGLSGAEAQRLRQAEADLKQRVELIEHRRAFIARLLSKSKVFKEKALVTA